jgi:hypothetical protein
MGLNARGSVTSWDGVVFKSVVAWGERQDEPLICMPAFRQGSLVSSGDDSVESLGSVDVIVKEQLSGYSCSFGINKESIKGDRKSRFVQKSKARYKYSPGKGTSTSAIKGTVLGPGHETCRGHVAGRLQRVSRRYPLI